MWRSGSLEKQLRPVRRCTLASWVGDGPAHGWLGSSHALPAGGGWKTHLRWMLFYFVGIFQQTSPLISREKGKTSQRWPSGLFWNNLPRQLICLKRCSHWKESVYVCVCVFFPRLILDSCRPFNLNLFIICFAAKHFGLLVHQREIGQKI